jgi:predicted DNA binding protein
MAETDDAFTLSSGTTMENVYATYANQMKALGNRARKESYWTKNQKRVPSAAEAYKKEVASLTSQLNTAMKNRPLERQAQLIANQVVAMKVKNDPSIKDDKDHYRKLKNQALEGARFRVGANKKNSSIVISDREWEAIQAGAVSPTQLAKILNNTDMDRIRQLATPKVSYGMQPLQIATAKSMANNGYTMAEIADRLGVSTSTISKAIND